MPRSPLLAVTPNRDNVRQQGEQKARMSQIATPGPPPRMSLSLMGGMAIPIQVRLENIVLYWKVDSKMDGLAADPLPWLSFLIFFSPCTPKRYVNLL